MKLQRLNNNLQDLCHEGYAQLEVAVLDSKMHEHTIRDIKRSPNGKIWIILNSPTYDDIVPEDFKVVEVK